uniref:Uncharacterized protein n=1 Tax=Anguilla anguilla TaxID=7936 RepID=A0A0E9VEV7_ANGAN
MLMQLSYPEVCLPGEVQQTLRRTNKRIFMKPEHVTSLHGSPPILQSIYSVW